MNIGDAVSSLTGGFWNGFASTSTGTGFIPKDHTLMLSKLTETQGATGGNVKTWTDVQSLQGSLQPTNGRERQEWSKETMTCNYKFYFDESQFTSEANEAELKEKSKLTQTTPSRTFDILGVMDRSVDGNYYLVYLSEKK